VEVRAYRDGKSIVICDGCHKPIPGRNPGGQRRHFHGRECQRKFVAPSKRKCPQCKKHLVATGEEVCMWCVAENRKERDKK
jgi:hypothetical protein